MVAFCRHLTRTIHATGSQLGKGGHFSREYSIIAADIFSCHNWEVRVGLGTNDI